MRLLSSFRPTLYVGKLDSHLYASTSLVHQGVSLVVSFNLFLSTICIHILLSTISVNSGSGYLYQTAVSLLTEAMTGLCCD